MTIDEAWATLNKYFDTVSKQDVLTFVGSIKKLTEFTADNIKFYYSPTEKTIYNFGMNKAIKSNKTFTRWLETHF